MNARELRLWHWRQAMYHRSKARLSRAYISSDKPGFALSVSMLDDSKADFHIQVVQFLNSHVECRKTTAEQDDSEGFK